MKKERSVTIVKSILNLDILPFHKSIKINAGKNKLNVMLFNTLYIILGSSKNFETMMPMIITAHASINCILSQRTMTHNVLSFNANVSNWRDSL